MLKMLECLQYCHKKAGGQCLMLYCRLGLFQYSCVRVTNVVMESADTIINHLEALNDEETFEQHLEISDVENAIRVLQDTGKPDLQLLANRLYQLAGRWYNMPTQLIVGDERQLGFDHSRCAIPDKKWFLDLMKSMCCNSNETRYLKIATMLDELSSEDMLEIMNSQNFNYKILPYCFLLYSHKHSQILSNPTIENYEPSVLFSTAKVIVYQRLGYIRSRLPKGHEVYEPVKRVPNDDELRYARSLSEIFSDKEFVDLIRTLIPVVDAYLRAVANLKSTFDFFLLVDIETINDLAHFSVVILELTHWLVKNKSVWSNSMTATTLECCSAILEMDEILNVIGASYIGSLTSALYILIENHTRDIIKFKKNPIFEKIPEQGTNSIRHSAHMVSILTEYFLCKMPIPLSDSVLYGCKMLLITLSRSPLVYDYVRVPLEVWKHVGPEDVVTKNCLTLNTISEYFLQDCDILQNVVSRLMFHGWNCRTQFEESWMSLLTALNSLPEQEVSEEEQQALSQVYVVTISAVTSLLVQTLYFPVPGRKTKPHVLHVSRNTFSFDKRRWKSKMEIVNDKLTWKAKIEDENMFSLFDNIKVNIERLHDKNKYNFNQISVEYLLLPSNLSSYTENREDLLRTYNLRQESIENLGIDTNSCVYFLMDFYSRWLLKPGEQSVQTLLEVTNSLIVMSDLFTEVTQFAWLLESGFDLWKKYSRLDDTVCAHLIVIICKASSVFVPLELESKKKVVRVLKIGVASNSVIVQTASLQGLLYLLERIFKRDILNQAENIDGPFQDEILSVAINYVLEKLDVDFTETYEEKTIHCIMSVGYYLIENKICGENTGLIVDRFIKLSVRACKMKWWSIHTTISQGMFNLILIGNSTVKKFDNELTQMVKEILSTVDCIPAAALLNLQILIASLYLADDVDDMKVGSSDDVFDSEKLIMKMEKISIFFERIKKCRRVEAKLICHILPQVLKDLFPPSEILNKVILEFLSPQQTYQDLLAEVVHQVFQNAIQQSQLSLIQDWVLSLLNNFSKCPKSKAVYYSTCFFISACTNTWLTALFPAIRMSYSNENEYESQQLLCIAAAQFYSELKDESQKQKLLSTFRATDSNILDERFEDILATILPK